MIDQFRPLLLTWLALLALLLAIAAAATWLSGIFSLIVILLGTTSMVGLIIAAFMGLRAAEPLQQVYATGGVLWLGFLIVLTMADYMTR